MGDYIDTRTPPGPELRAAADPEALIAQLEALVNSRGTLKATEAQRHEIKRLSVAAVGVVEEPFETMVRVIYSPLQLVTVRIAQEHGIFARLVAADGPVSFSTLADETDMEPYVLESLLDYLGTQHMLLQVTQGSYAPTRLTYSLVEPLFNDTVTHYHETFIPGFAALSAQIKSKSKKTAFEIGHDFEGSFYEWAETRPEVKGAFHRFMEAQFAGMPSWLSVVDFRADFGSGLDADGGVAFVDVGGGIGQQCALLRKEVPGLPGRVVLQDSEYIVAKALEVEGMESMAYDYFTEQPVKNACVYYFRQILHNNTDEDCVRIVRSHLPAMGPRSRVVIDEKCLPDEKPPPDAPGVDYTASLSLGMKVIFNAQERREAHWRRLLGGAGLVVEDVRRFTANHDAVIIARRA